MTKKMRLISTVLTGVFMAISLIAIPILELSGLFLGLQIYFDKEIYVFTKIIVVLLQLLFILYFFKVKRSNSMIVSQLVLTGILTFLPLIIRILLANSYGKNSLAVAILIILIYLIAIFILDIVKNNTVFSKEREKMTVRKMVLISIMAALSIVLGFIEIPWGLSYIPGLKLDFSDIVTIIALGILGFSSTTIMLFLRAILRILVLRISSPLGPLAGLFEEFMAHFASYMLVFGYLVARKVIGGNNQVLKSVFEGLFVVFFVAISMVLFNFIFSTPFYLYFVMGADNLHLSVFTMIKDSSYVEPLIFFGMKDASVFSFFVFCLISYLPFNAVKGLINMTVFEMAYPRLHKAYQKVISN